MKLIIYFVLLALAILLTMFVTFGLFVPLKQEFEKYIIFINIANFCINFYIIYRMSDICEYLIKKLNK